MNESAYEQVLLAVTAAERDDAIIAAEKAIEERDAAREAIEALNTGFPVDVIVTMGGNLLQRRKRCERAEASNVELRAQLQSATEARDDYRRRLEVTERKFESHRRRSSDAVVLLRDQIATLTALANECNEPLQSSSKPVSE